MIGEETGGGAYGNSAWLIPDVTLPETGIRFRLPLFRLVIDKNIPKNGRGVQPEVPSFPTIEAVKKGVDYKLEKTMELIKEDRKPLPTSPKGGGHPNTALAFQSCLLLYLFFIELSYL